MIIKIEPPPNYDKLKAVFTLHKGIVFTYGDVIYNPDGLKINRPLLKHEETHFEQQKKYGVEDWWDRYMMQTAFRLSQEIPAFQAQYKEAKKKLKDKNWQYRYLLQLAGQLSSELYGKLITFEEAKNAIQKDEPFAFDI